MTSALFLDVPNIITTKSKKPFPIHREDWTISDLTLALISKHINLGHQLVLVGNFANINVSKKDINPIVNLLTNVAETLEKNFDLRQNSIPYDYSTDVESYDYLPLPGLFYNIAVDYEIILPMSFIITTPLLGKFIQQYSGVKCIITDAVTKRFNN